MTEWSLTTLLSGLHEDIECRLSIARRAFQHSGTKGDASEQVWLELLRNYLPSRYCAEKAHIVDSNGQFSQQIDVAIFDRQYTPLVFKHEGQLIVPAESVYAVFEAKQTVNAGYVAYAQEKISSVRKLHRTSLPIPFPEGTYKAKPLPKILGGLLAFESDWSPALGQPFIDALKVDNDLESLDLGCIATHGIFGLDEAGTRTISLETKAATAFVLELIAVLQSLGTVPMIDTRAYARWLPKKT
ncbi:MAG: hypothetical protein K2X29_10105 [Candidatus Obscuribacterales bacterium]|nr:hypothetical protein [Candidatus Obscuribacterales bacterium]